jgi:CRISPR/Cas system-associated exonuclease Cas4 (RecB family)
MSKFTTNPARPRWIKASEIGEYLYCQRAWWYRLQGFSSANVQELERGTGLHYQHSRSLSRASWQRVIAFLFIVTAIVILVLQVMQ